MHSLSISIVMWVDCLKTVADYNSADECVTDSDEIMCDGHVLCLKMIMNLGYFCIIPSTHMIELQSINKKITFLLTRRVTFSSHYFPQF